MAKRFDNMGRKELGYGQVSAGRIVIAVILGCLVGGLWAYVSPKSFFFQGTSFLEGSVIETVPNLPVKVDDKVRMLKEELVALRNENEKVLKRELEVKKQMRIVVQERNVAREQLKAFGPAEKAGPVGTVKSIRAHPLVESDEASNPKLLELLKVVAVNKELIVGIANRAVLDMVKVWTDSIKRTGTTNFLVIALDDATADFCRQQRIAMYRRDAAISSAQAGTGDNHAISGLKFHLLREFLVLGYSVLLSDVDIVYLQNPFHYLYRDCDVESMSDGFDNITAYGYDDVSDDASMGWARYAHTMRIWVFNSGLFYIRPTVASIELLDRVTARLSKEKAWDQAVFNEELFFPSHPGYVGLHASKRVLDFYLFLNSKVMFKIIRKDPMYKDLRPVTIHVNYHPDKLERMIALVDYYVSGNIKALERFPDGSQW